MLILIEFLSKKEFVKFDGFYQKPLNLIPVKINTLNWFKIFFLQILPSWAFQGCAPKIVQKIIKFSPIIMLTIKPVLVK